jgi:hypothetical protein
VNFTDAGFDFDDGDLERRLACLPVPPMPADLAARCRVLVATGVGSNRSRGSRRLILLGTAAVIAAAAAMLAVQFTGAPESTHATAAVPARVTEPERTEEPAPAVAPQTSTEVAPKITPVPAADVATPFTVRMLPLKNEARNVNARTSIDFFYNAFLAELRAVPGLVLITPESTGVAEGSVESYRLELQFNDAVLPGKWNLMIRAEALLPGPDSRAYLTVPISVMGAEDSPGMAAAQVDLLRSLVLPLDQARRRQLLSRLQDRKLDPALRQRALTELHVARVVMPEGGRPGKLQTPPLDEAMIRGAMDLVASSNAGVRETTWRELRGAANPVLLAPLAHAALHDESQAVRLLTIGMLAQEYATEPTAISALKAAAVDDPSQLVRTVAQKAIAGGTAGEALWREYVLATLGDATLTAAQRLEPLSYMDQSRQSTAGLFDDAAMKSLAPLFPAMFSGGFQMESLARRMMDSLQAVSHPAVVDLYVEALRASVNPMTRSAAVRVLAEKHSKDERARKALESVAAGDPDPSLRQKAADALSGAATPPPGT